MSKVPKTILGTEFILSIRERIVLLSLLPEKGNFYEQMISQDIEAKTNVTKKEIEESELKTIFNRELGRAEYTWNPEKDKKKKIKFTPSEISLLKSRVDRLDKESSITRDNLSVCKMIRESQPGNAKEEEAKNEPGPEVV